MVSTDKQLPDTPSPGDTPSRSDTPAPGRLPGRAPGSTRTEPLEPRAEPLIAGNSKKRGAPVAETVNRR